MSNVREFIEQESQHVLTSPPMKPLNIGRGSSSTASTATAFFNTGAGFRLFPPSILFANWNAWSLDNARCFVR